MDEESINDYDDTEKLDDFANSAILEFEDYTITIDGNYMETHPYDNLEVYEEEDGSIYLTYGESKKTIQIINADGDVVNNLPKFVSEIERGGGRLVWGSSPAQPPEDVPAKKYVFSSLYQPSSGLIPASHGRSSLSSRSPSQLAGSSSQSKKQKAHNLLGVRVPPLKRPPKLAPPKLAPPKLAPPKTVQMDDGFRRPLAVPPPKASGGPPPLPAPLPQSSPPSRPKAAKPDAKGGPPPLPGKNAARLGAKKDHHAESPPKGGDGAGFGLGG